MPSWEDFQPFIVTGLALGGVYALSGVGLVVLYRATGVLNLLFGPPLAGRDPLVKATATLGLALILLGAMSWIWSDKARSMILPTSNENFMVSDVLVNYTQVIGFTFGVMVTLGTAAFLYYTNPLPFLVFWARAAALIARLNSLTVTLLAGIVVGLVTALITPILSISEYRDMTPFVLAIIALLWLSRHREVSIGRAGG